MNNIDIIARMLTEDPDVLNELELEREPTDVRQQRLTTQASQQAAALGAKPGRGPSQQRGIDQAAVQKQMVMDRQTTTRLLQKLATFAPREPGKTDRSGVARAINAKLSAGYIKQLLTLLKGAQLVELAPDSYIISQKGMQLMSGTYQLTEDEFKAVAKIGSMIKQIEMAAKNAAGTMKQRAAQPAR